MLHSISADRSHQHPLETHLSTLVSPVTFYSSLSGCIALSLVQGAAVALTCVSFAEYFPFTINFILNKTIKSLPYQIIIANK